VTEIAFIEAIPGRKALKRTKKAKNMEKPEQNKLPENTEIHAAVVAVAEEAGVGGEGQVPGMFQDEPAILCQDLRGEDQVGEFRKAGMVIGRVCEDEVEGLVRMPQITEHIAPDGGGVLKTELGDCLPDKFILLRVRFNGHHRAGLPGCEFIGDAPGAGEQVQHVQIFQIEPVDQDIEQTLLGLVGGRTGFHAPRGVDLLSPV